MSNSPAVMFCALRGNMSTGKRGFPCASGRCIKEGETRDNAASVLKSVFFAIVVVELSLFFVCGFVRRTMQLKRVERFGIMRQDFFFHAGIDAFHALKFIERRNCA